MPQGPPPGIAALLGGGGPPPGHGEPDADDAPLKTLQDVIHAVVGLLHNPSLDAQDKVVVSKVLQMLMPLQAKMMSGANGGQAAQSG